MSYHRVESTSALLQTAMVVLLLFATLGCKPAVNQSTSGLIATASGDKQKSSVQTTLDFERVKPTSLTKKTIQISNPHPYEVTIAGFRAGCGCTAATVLNPVIPAHGTTDIKIAFQAGKDSGNIRKYVLVDAVGGTSPLAEVEVLAQIADDIHAVPEQVFRDLNYGGDEETIPIDVYNYTAEEWEGIRVESDVSWVTVTTPREALRQSDGINSSGEKSDFRQRWQVKITIARQESTVRPAILEASLRVSARPNSAIQMVVPLRVAVRPPIVILPPQLVFSGSSSTNIRTVAVEASAGESVVPKSSQPPMFARIVPSDASTYLEVGQGRLRSGRWLFEVQCTPANAPLQKSRSTTIEIVSSDDLKVVGQIPVILQ